MGTTCKCPQEGVRLDVEFGRSYKSKLRNNGWSDTTEPIPLNRWLIENEVMLVEPIVKRVNQEPPAGQLDGS